MSYFKEHLQAFLDTVYQVETYQLEVGGKTMCQFTVRQHHGIAMQSTILL